eukprot:841257-Rhodomonas_salina.1
MAAHICACQKRCLDGIPRLLELFWRRSRLVLSIFVHLSQRKRGGHKVRGRRKVHRFSNLKLKALQLLTSVAYAWKPDCMRGRIGRLKGRYTRPQRPKFPQEQKDLTARRCSGSQLKREHGTLEKKISTCAFPGRLPGPHRAIQCHARVRESGKAFETGNKVFSDRLAVCCAAVVRLLWKHNNCTLLSDVDTQDTCCRELVDALLKGMQDSDPDVATAAAKSLTELNPHGDTKAVST